jgi:hypothetical protein
MEHQLKLHSESLQSKIEDIEKENSDLQIKNKSLTEVFEINLENQSVKKI